MRCQRTSGLWKSGSGQGGNHRTKPNPEMQGAGKNKRRRRQKVRNVPKNATGAEETGEEKEAAKSLLRHKSVRGSVSFRYSTNFFNIPFTNPGPSYTNPVYTCTRSAPASNFSRADAAESMPPTPMMTVSFPNFSRK